MSFSFCTSDASANPDVIVNVQQPGAIMTRRRLLLYTTPSSVDAIELAAHPGASLLSVRRDGSERASGKVVAQMTARNVLVLMLVRFRGSIVVILVVPVYISLAEVR